MSRRLLAVVKPSAERDKKYYDLTFYNARSRNA